MKNSRTYIKIPNRLFLIGKRGYGGWSRDLNLEDRKILMKLLSKHGIECYAEGIQNMFKDEEIKANEQCNCRVITKLGDQDYTIQNYNTRCLKYESAVKIASFLLNKGLDADIEIIEGFRGRRTIKSSKNKKDNKTKQINMFGQEISDTSYLN